MGEVGLYEPEEYTGEVRCEGRKDGLRYPGGLRGSYGVYVVWSPIVMVVA